MLLLLTAPEMMSAKPMFAPRSGLGSEVFQTATGCGCQIGVLQQAPG